MTPCGQHHPKAVTLKSVGKLGSLHNRFTNNEYAHVSHVNSPDTISMCLKRNRRILIKTYPLLLSKIVLSENIQTQCHIGFAISDWTVTWVNFQDIIFLRCGSSVFDILLTSFQLWFPFPDAALDPICTVTRWLLSSAMYYACNPAQDE